jgi:Holliday junction DNA helicase RuvB
MSQVSSLDSLVGQHHAIERLKTEVQHAHSTGTTMAHVLLTGGPGLGKSTLGRVLAQELGYEFHCLDGGRKWTHDRVMTFLLRLSADGYSSDGVNQGGPRHLIFLDEAHTFPVDPWLIPMEQCEVYVDGRVCWLPDFMVVAATTEVLPQPFVDRCGINIELEPYTTNDLAEIIHRRYPTLGADACIEVAKRGRGTPRIALEYARVTDMAPTLEEAFKMLQVNEHGLRPLDLKYLDALSEENRPLSLNTLCAKLGTDEVVLRRVVEPFLLRLGFIRITGSGRALAVPARGPKGAAANSTAAAALDRFLHAS